MANNLVRFDPISDIARLDPFRTLDDFLRDFRMMPALRGMEAEPRIRLEMSENDQAYMVKAEIPGVKKEDIKVSIDGNQVSLTAEVRQEQEDTSASMMRSERFYGQQSRCFTLPQDIDDAQAEARYQDGILELTLPKRPGTGGKQLTIQ